MKKILLITNRNVLTSSGELRLIKNRAESLFRIYGVQTDIIAFVKKDKILKKNENIECGGKLKVIPFSVFGVITLIKAMRNAIINNTYSYVLLSGVGMPVFSRIIKLFSDVSVGVDIHGASEDEIFGIKDKNIISKIKSIIYYYTDKIGLKIGLKRCDSAFVVTESLKKYIINSYSLKQRFRFFIVPCATNDYDINKKKIVHCKLAFRKKYNIEDDALVFIYSGGVSKWQCIDKMLMLYKSIRENTQYKTYLVIYSQGIDYIKSMTNGMHECIIDIYSADDLQDALCVGDYAFMLREDCPTNNVAFPNKFLEYLRAGNCIITTPYLHDIANIIQKTNVGIIYSFDDDIHKLIENIELHKELVDDGQIELRKRILKMCGFEMRLKSFVDSIK